MNFLSEGVGSLLARFQLSEGPSKPSPLVVQFTSEGSTLSSCDIELVGAGYRFSLIKKRFAAGKEKLNSVFPKAILMIIISLSQIVGKDSIGKMPNSV